MSKKTKPSKQRTGFIRRNHGVEGVRKFRALKKEASDLIATGYRVKWALEALPAARAVGAIGAVKVWLRRRELEKTLAQITKRLKTLHAVTAFLLQPKQVNRG